MVECPVCHKIVESEFALGGHLRLTKDTVHVAFHQQDQKIIVPEANVPIPSTLQDTSPKLVDTLEDFIRNQERLHGENAKMNKNLMKLKEIIEQERDVEKKYEKLIESEEESLEQKRQKVREEVMQHHQEDVDKAVANMRMELMLNREQELAAARAEGKKEGISEGYWKATLCIPCVFCGQNICVRPNSDIHRWLIELAAGAWFSHPGCQRDYEQQQAEYYRQQEYHRRVARL